MYKLISILSILLLSTVAYANPCSKFKTPKGSHAKFGDSIKKAERVYKRKTPSANEQVMHDTNVFVVLTENTKNYKAIAYGHLNNVIHTIMVVYKEDFVRRKGDLVNAFTILSKTLAKRHGKADDTSKTDTEFNLIWNDVNGVEIVMMAEPPTGLKIRYQCKAQKQKLMDKIAKDSEDDL